MQSINFLQNTGCGSSTSAGSRRPGRRSKEPRRGSTAPRLRPQLIKGAAPFANSSTKKLFFKRLGNFETTSESTQQHRCRLALLRAGAGEPVLVPVSPPNPGAVSIPHTSRHPLLAATVNFPFMAIQNFSLLACRSRCTAPLCWRDGRAGRGAQMYGWETRKLLKHYLDQGVSKTGLSRRFGVNRRTIHHWIGTGISSRCAGVFAAAAGGAQAGFLQGNHRRASRGVPDGVGEAVVRRGPRDGLSGRVQARAGVCPCDTATRVGRPVRDAGFGCHKSPSRVREPYSTVFYGDLLRFRLVSPRRAMRVVD